MDNSDSRQPNSNNAITLENCADEPIHIPGLIQPHGALLAFDLAGNLIVKSVNLQEILGFDIAFGTHIEALPFEADIREALAESLEDFSDGDVAPLMLPTAIGDKEFDFVVHAFHGRVIAEFELRQQSSDVVAAFALKAHRSIDRLKRQRSLQSLLDMAVEQIRAITGFDRVMAYRFRHDDSGDIVAEARRLDLEPFLGRRYPASDIPAQARRLYILNTLRLISDVNYTAVPLAAASSDAPLDMSHCILRSVSPIHVEYLQNLGVTASMSVSIVVNGKLWGMIACHHMSPRQVPYSIRMACDVIAQVLAASVQTLDSREHAELTDRAVAVRTQLYESLLLAEDIMQALQSHAEGLIGLFGADAMIAVQGGKSIHVGSIAPEVVEAIVASLPDSTSDVFYRSKLTEWPTELQPVLGRWVGILGMRIDPASHAWLLLLRCEQIETVRWGGRPEKDYKIGPLGPRLTPRGSFDEWRQIVRGTAVPWEAPRLSIARQLLSYLMRASNTRHAETAHARTHLLAMLGHDLRDPLASISMAAMVLEEGNQQQKLGRRIQASSDRMKRLISVVLDISRIKGGLGLDLRKTRVDLTALIDDLVDEARHAYPGIDYRLSLPDRIEAHADGDRIAQVVSNLISNARHHGAAGNPIDIDMVHEKDAAVIRVKNVGAPISPQAASQLFNPFKRKQEQNDLNRSGLGLGLYIASEIMKAHDGSIAYRQEGPLVVFEVILPLA
jgi:light-regulated signal transduction histidine kinase (bacteriophytochrome)